MVTGAVYVPGNDYDVAVDVSYVGADCGEEMCSAEWYSG